MPAWAVMLSVVATWVNAGIFVGRAQLSYNGDLTPMLSFMGSVIGSFILAMFFIPLLYRAGTLTVFGFLERRFGVASSSAGSVLFMLGKLMWSGARLFLAGIVFSMVIFGDIKPMNLAIAISIFGVVGTIYTVLGGIRAVIWTDVIQIIVVFGVIIFCLVTLLNMIPLSAGEIFHELRNADGINKLQVVDTSFSLNDSWNIWAMLIGIFTFLAVCSDQEFMQRLLACQSPWHAARAQFGAVLTCIPIVLLAHIVGLLLYIFYGRPDLMAGSGVEVEALENTKQLFPQFVMNHLPVGMPGLVMAGLFSAAMSTFDSSINALASTVVGDLRGTWAKLRHKPFVEECSIRESRLISTLMGVLLTLFAIFCILLQSWGKDNLLDFAMRVMAFASAGLLGVFLTAMFTKRGNTTSVLAALAVGFAVVMFMQPYALPVVTKWLFGLEIRIGWVRWPAIGAPISFLVCIAGRPKHKGPQS